ncbi:DASH complex subunit dam1 [Pseudocyphellaria aurata]|nr:DASH complex subunit dam1 [Pseudocyphellaria aurata]
MSRNRPPSRPTTPLRPSSRTSLRESQGNSARDASSSFPLESWEPAFAELSDSMADLEANFMHLQLMHESLSRFNESFASFLYGLNMNAFCVDFPEAPLLQSFQRAAQNEETSAHAAEPDRYRQDGRRIPRMCLTFQPLRVLHQSSQHQRQRLDPAPVFKDAEPEALRLAQEVEQRAVMGEVHEAVV